MTSLGELLSEKQPGLIARTARCICMEHRVHAIGNRQLFVQTPGTTWHPVMALADEPGRFQLMMGSGDNPGNRRALRRKDILPAADELLHVRRHELAEDTKLTKDTLFFLYNVPLAREEFFAAEYLDDFARYPAIVTKIKTLKEKYRNG